MHAPSCCLLPAYGACLSACSPLRTLSSPCSREFTLGPLVLPKFCSCCRIASHDKPARLLFGLHSAILGTATSSDRQACVGTCRPSALTQQPGPELDIVLNWLTDSVLARELAARHLLLGALRRRRVATGWRRSPHHQCAPTKQSRHNLHACNSPCSSLDTKPDMAAVAAQTCGRARSSIPPGNSMVPHRRRLQAAPRAAKGDGSPTGEPSVSDFAEQLMRDPANAARMAKVTEAAQRVAELQAGERRRRWQRWRRQTWDWAGQLCPQDGIAHHCLPPRDGCVPFVPLPTSCYPPLLAAREREARHRHGGSGGRGVGWRRGA